jgi:serine/threonine-protein kinase
VSDRGTAISSDRAVRLDKYELLAEIGHGGMATVYRARDLRLERDVAVKLIHKHLREIPDVRRRFVAEAKAVAKLRHPGIVDVYDVSDEQDEERYLVVELIGGTTLRKVLDEHGHLPSEIGAILTLMLCDAVQHAHDSAVIHRDIKPENVLIEMPQTSLVPTSPSASESPRALAVRVKLTDFGIAKVLDAQGVTSTGQILGSPAHMAPEQIEGGRVGPHTDVFALGVLMYECMVGHLPFQGGNPAQVLRRVLEGQFEAADFERPEVGARWSLVLERALHVDPVHRLQSASGLACLIEAELGELGIDDPQRSLDDFFADPEGFRERLASELVVRLISRGERERKHGDVQGAAADFNRALAFRPDDLAILRRVGALTARRRWKERGLRATGIALTAFVLGATSYGLTRIARPRPRTATAGAPSAPAPVEVALGDPSSELGPRVSARPTVTLEASGARSAAALVVPVASTPGPVEPVKGKARRKVKLTLMPPGAKVRVDGSEIDWFGKPFHELTVGSHTVEGFMPDDNPCCVAVTMSIQVSEPPVDKPDERQTFRIPLTFRDARVTLTGAPTGAAVSCDNGLVFGAGGGSSRMNDVQKKASCTFMPGGKRQSITLVAGTGTAIPWP